MEPLLDHITASLCSLIASCASFVPTAGTGPDLHDHIRRKLVSLDASLFPCSKVQPSSKAFPAAVHQDEDEDIHHTLLCEAQVEDESIDFFFPPSSPSVYPLQQPRDPSSDLDFVESLEEDEAALFQDEIQADIDDRYFSDDFQETIRSRYKRRRYEDKPFYYA